MQKSSLEKRIIPPRLPEWQEARLLCLSCKVGYIRPCLKQCLPTLSYWRTQCFLSIFVRSSPWYILEMTVKSNKTRNWLSFLSHTLMLKYWAITILWHTARINTKRVREVKNTHTIMIMLVWLSYRRHVITQLQALACHYLKSRLW